MDLFQDLSIVHGIQTLHVLPLQLKQSDVLFVVDLQLQVFLILDLVLQKHIISGCLLQSNSQVSGNDNVDHIDLLNVDSQLVEPQVEFPHHLGSEFRLDVSDLAHLDLSDEVSDAFLRFLFQQLLQSVGSQVVKELVAVVLPGIVLSNLESYADIY